MSSHLISNLRRQQRSKKVLVRTLFPERGELLELLSLQSARHHNATANRSGALQRPVLESRYLEAVPSRFQLILISLTFNGFIDEDQAPTSGYKS